MLYNIRVDSHSVCAFLFKGLHYRGWLVCSVAYYLRNYSIFSWISVALFDLSTFHSTSTWHVMWATYVWFVWLTMHGPIDFHGPIFLAHIFGDHRPTNHSTKPALVYQIAAARNGTTSSRTSSLSLAFIAWKCLDHGLELLVLLAFFIVRFVCYSSFTVLGSYGISLEFVVFSLKINFKNNYYYVVSWRAN